MAVSEFYTSDDLLVRRTGMADWICSQLKKFVNYYHYGSTIEADCLIKHQYITALLEVVECYTPITATAEDGVNNCMTEAKLTTLFDKVEEITGLCFLPIGTTYNPNYDATIPLLNINLNTPDGAILQENSLADMKENLSEREIKK